VVVGGEGGGYEGGFLGCCGGIEVDEAFRVGVVVFGIAVGIVGGW